ncbi:MAG: DUF4339 domain-containing protein [Pirellulales bacterium]|nr:DUF4339 domain-containing protein [Pirellulales bacterium]
MGIRFFCPNGHKLNVKEFQAGMRGVCPHCGAKFIIPAQSTRTSSKEKNQLRQDETIQGGTVTLSPPSLGQGEAAPPGNPSPAVESSSLVSPQAQAVAAPDEYPLAATSDSAVAGDAIAAAGNVVWYVRPPSGGQYGPASGEVLRSWLNEGRISGDTLVWRQGWSDWQEAQLLFPELRQAAAAPLPSLADLSGPAAHSPAVPLGLKRKTTWNKQKTLVIGLAVLVLILIVLFIVVLCL